MTRVDRAAEGLADAVREAIHALAWEPEELEKVRPGLLLILRAALAEWKAASGEGKR